MLDRPTRSKIRMRVTKEFSKANKVEIMQLHLKSKDRTQEIKVTITRVVKVAKRETRRITRTVLTTTR